MRRIGYDDSGMKSWIAAAELDGYRGSLAAAEKMLSEKTGPGGEYTGWVGLPAQVDGGQLGRMTETAQELRGKSDVMVCIGIGGSYLGARAAIEFMSPTFEDMRAPRVVFAGHAINSDYLSDLLALLEGKQVAVNVISKSGTTTEPGITFRIVRAWMEKRYGKKEAASRIVATTDPKKGALRALARDEGYRTFPIPADVGGRYSVLTPVGLLPIAYAGIDIAKLVSGASDALEALQGADPDRNIAGRYACVRNILFRRGKMIEVLAAFQPHLHFVSEWWKQLAGESEGKNCTGIFPAGLDYTTDLHSLGQWMQEGVRSVFETFILLKKTRTTLTIPRFTDDGDELNYLAGRSLEEINRNAFKGTLLAHLDGGVPASVLTLEDRSEETLGELFYFFEKAIALSGYLLRVNPFDQPGVEAYKKNMFALLAKPGFEASAQAIKERVDRLGL